MKYLFRVFNEEDFGEFERIYNKRISFDSTKRVNLSIKPINQSNCYDLYYIPSNKMIEKVSKIYITSRKLEVLFSKLPSIAKDQFIEECMVEELYRTNELEGVESSKQEIAKSAREIRLNRVASQKRFDSMIKSYIGLIKSTISLPQSPKDIREIYDNITEGEIAENELPDGQVFRKDITNVYKRTGSGKVIHRGVVPEKAIHDGVHDLLKLMNEEESIPELIRIAIGHFFFGYLHPFYDGNGRTSRFISSLYLAETLGKISALSLSRGCSKYSKEYLDSFELTNSIKNRGELNQFIEVFLSIISWSLEEMVSELKEKKQLLEMALQKIKKEPKLEDKSETHKNLMFVLAQDFFFHSGDGLTASEFSSALSLTSSTIRKYANDLFELSLIEKRGERPIFYMIKSSYFEDE